VTLNKGYKSIYCNNIKLTDALAGTLDYKLGANIFLQGQLVGDADKMFYPYSQHSEGCLPFILEPVLTIKDSILPPNIFIDLGKDKDLLRVTGDFICNSSVLEFKEYSKDRLLNKTGPNYIFKDYDTTRRKGDKDRVNSFIVSMKNAIESHFEFILVLDCYQTDLSNQEILEVESNFKDFIKKHSRFGFNEENLKLVILQGIRDEENLLNTRLAKLVQ